MTTTTNAQEHVVFRMTTTTRGFRDDNNNTWHVVFGSTTTTRGFWDDNNNYTQHVVFSGWQQQHTTCGFQDNNNTQHMVCHRHTTTLEHMTFCNDNINAEKQHHVCIST
jgi:hypothetical protein